MNKPSLLLTTLALLTLAACTTRQTQTGHDVNVFYATNRQNTGSSDPEKTFGPNANDNPQQVTYGKAEVHIPADHAAGSYDGVKIDGYKPLSMPLEEFYKEITPAGPANTPHTLFVYVHGFNNTFGSAVRRAANFANDLAPASAPYGVIYSWPSAGALLDYWKDEDSVMLSQPCLRRFLSSIHTHAASARTVLIGHSMGCRALTYALRDYFLEEIRTQGWHLKPVFNDLVFIEPDVNAEYFQQNLLEVESLCQRITIYTESHDIALKASRTVHQYQSLGLADLPLGSRVDIIDASAARNDFLGHSYDGPLFFNDLRQVMQGVPADKRATLVPENQIYRLVKK